MTIPDKCGIVGYVAWTGCPEAIDGMYKDPRTSYSEHDSSLDLKNMLVMNLFDDTDVSIAKNGVLILNYGDAGFNTFKSSKKEVITLIGNIQNNNELIDKLAGRDFKKAYSLFLKALEPHGLE